LRISLIWNLYLYAEIEKRIFIIYQFRQFVDTLFFLFTGT
jgi:hypothetical protein